MFISPRDARLTIYSWRTDLLLSTSLIKLTPRSCCSHNSQGIGSSKNSSNSFYPCWRGTHLTGVRWQGWEAPWISKNKMFHSEIWETEGGRRLKINLHEKDKNSLQRLWGQFAKMFFMRYLCVVLSLSCLKDPMRSYIIRSRHYKNI